MLLLQTLAFAANYYDASGSNPKTAEIVIDNTAKPLSVILGVAAKGTWQYVMNDDRKVHCYLFLYLQMAQVSGSGFQQQQLLQPGMNYHIQPFRSVIRKLHK